MKKNLLYSLFTFSFFGFVCFLIFSEDLAESSSVENKEAEKTSHQEKRSPAQEVTPKKVEPEKLTEDLEEDKQAETHCVVDPVALEDIKKRKEELDVRAKELEQKETELKAAKTAFEEEFQKIKQVRDEIEKFQSLSKKTNEEKIAKLVETLETMSPKSAAKLLESIESPLAVTTMSRMSTVKLAKILNIMELGESSQLTEMMAGLVKAKKSQLPVGSSQEDLDIKSKKKGGEDKNGNNTKSANDTSARVPSQEKSSL